ncbi:YfjI family protein [Pseudodesulfovibrio piezophilus]|uniref:DUF3987 domain-containing protein n=1 Tax=Pseudodesulfovibrio piezophilus (strain DSM 21447 / JCM 15486 / C1TLV30) TaxID=1322246 RepID=M1WRE3_PSEP2|nr:YfjI family protein [Pseudodesulfovibrio piezophilus]CCH49489.1 protein of unknown function [Pseudodesulfovibrio piezophilus C1TLV30]
MLDSEPEWKFKGVGPNRIPIIEQDPPIPAPLVNYNHGSSFSLSQTDAIKVNLAQHNEEKALRQAEKERLTFALEDQENLDKSRWHAWIKTVQIFPLAQRQVVDFLAPIEALPGRARKWVEDLSKAFAVHPGILVALLLGFVSILLRGQFKVMRHKNHTELVTLYLLIMMLSGKMKSPLMEEVLRPIMAIEKRLQGSFFENKELLETTERLIKKRIRTLENAAAKEGDLEVAAQEILELQKSIPAKQYLPVLLTFKFTPEGLEKEAAKQNGKIAIAAAELGSLKKIPANRDDFLLQAYGGESFSSTKAGEPVRIENPSVTILIATQDGTAVKLLSEEALQDDGLVARFLCLLPPELYSPAVGGGTSEVPTSSTKWLEETANKLFEASSATDEGIMLHFEDQALQGWHGLEAHAKAEAANDVNPPVLQAFYRKLAGTCLRLIAIIHILRCCENGEPYETLITKESVSAGMQLAWFFEQHTKVALNLKAKDKLDRAHAILEYLVERGEYEVNVREIYRAKHWKREETLPALKLLQAHGYMVIYKSGASRTCIINPHLFHMA